MPNIPTFEPDIQPHLAAVPTASPSALAVPGEQLARAGGDMSALMSEFNQRYQEGRRAADASNLLANGTQQLGDSQFRWSKVADRQKALDGFNTESATIKKNLLQGVVDPEEQLILSREFDTQQAMRAVDTGHAAFGLESKMRIGQLDDNLLTYAQQMAQTDDPAIRAKLMDNATGAIHTAVAAGWLDPDDGEKLVRLQRSRADEVQFRKVLNAAIESQSPELAQAAERMINDDSQLPGLDPDRREVLSQHAAIYANRVEQHAIALQAHQDAIAEREMRIEQGKNATQMLARIWSGEPVDPITVTNMAMSGQLSETGLEAVHRAEIDQGKGHDNALAGSNVWHLINTHDPGALDALHQLIATSQVSASTAARMQNAIDAAGPASNKAAAAMYSTLRTQLNGDIIEQGRTPGGDSDRALANWTEAQGEWARRVTQNHEDPTNVLTDLMARYAPGSRPTWLPAPIAGRPQSWADMVKVAKQTKALHDQKMIDDATFASQNTLLRQYGEFIKPPPTGAARQPQMGAQP